MFIHAANFKKTKSVSTSYQFVTPLRKTGSMLPNPLLHGSGLLAAAGTALFNRSFCLRTRGFRGRFEGAPLLESKHNWQGEIPRSKTETLSLYSGLEHSFYHPSSSEPSTQNSSTQPYPACLELIPWRARAFLALPAERRERSMPITVLLKFVAGYGYVSSNCSSPSSSWTKITASPSFLALANACW